MRSSTPTRRVRAKRTAFIKHTQNSQVFSIFQSNLPSLTYLRLPGCSLPSSSVKCLPLSQPTRVFSCCSYVRRGFIFVLFTSLSPATSRQQPAFMDGGEGFSSCLSPLPFAAASVTRCPGRYWWIRPCLHVLTIVPSLLVLSSRLFFVFLWTRSGDGRFDPGGHEGGIR